MAEYVQDVRVRYSDFKTMENFKKLIHKFLSFDTNNGENALKREREVVNFIEGKSSNPIAYCLVVESILEEEEEVEIDFVHGFLESRCHNLHDDYINFLASKTLETSHIGLLGVYNKIDPYKKNLLLSITNLKKIKSLNIMPYHVIDMILQEMEKTLKFIKSKRTGYAANFERQISFNLNSNELIALFQKFRELGIVKDLGHANLGFLMEQYFKYKKVENGEYSEFKNCASGLEGAHNSTKNLTKACTSLNKKLETSIFIQKP